MSDLCIICGHDLRPEEVSTCTRCVGRVRRDLARIADLTPLLPQFVQGYATNTAPSIRGRTDESPLLGGDALAMLAGGTVNTVRSSRTGNRAHAADQWKSDPFDPLVVLESCVREWAELRGDEPPTPVPTISSETSYLIRNCGWAGSQHPAFDEYAALFAELRSRIERATAHDPATVYGAECIQILPDGETCGGQLVREYEEPCGLQSGDEALCKRRGCTKKAGHVQGLSDWWTCRRCKRRTDHRRHNLAVHEQLLRVSTAS